MSLLDFQVVEQRDHVVRHQRSVEFGLMWPIAQSMTSQIEGDARELPSERLGNPWQAPIGWNREAGDIPTIRSSFATQLSWILDVRKMICWPQ